MNKVRFLFTIVLIFLCFQHRALALSPETHAEINRRMAEANLNGFYLNDYLIKNLDVSDGINATFYRRGTLGIKDHEYVFDWIYLGGKYEDTLPEPYIFARSYNHFHDPTKPLDQAGFSDWLHTSFISIPLHTGVSSIVWALSKDEQFNAPGLGDYSWPAARNYFYNALTATDEGTRNDNFSDCFRSIGQLMHLVEDVSVPEHTRNEEHAFGYHYEVWVNDNLKDPIFNTSMANPVIPYNTVLASSGNPDSRIGGLPVSRLFDTDNFKNGQNPALTTGDNANIGLAEYTNANFFGRRSAMKYYYPGAANTLQEWSDNNPAGTKKKLYYKKTGDGVPVNHLAAKAYLDDVFGKYNLQNAYDKWILLDENCYKDYAALLLPRAEGYAFSLMQYFFRGQIEAVDPATTTDANGNISGVTLKARNKTPKVGGTSGEIEPIGGGDESKNNLVVSYQYTQGGQTTYGKSSPLRFDNYSGHQYEFTGFTSPIPPDATSKKYTLVYRGKLGDENDAVAAKSIETADGDLYVLTEHNGGGYQEGAINFTMQRISKSDGTVKWDQVYTPGSASIDYEAQLFNVSVGGDGVYFSFVYYSEPYDQQVDEHLQKRSKTDGHLIWEKHRSYGPSWQVFQPYVTADHTGVFVITSNFHTSAQYSWQTVMDAYIERLDPATGQTLWSTPLLLDWSCNLFAAPIAIDSKYVYVASVDGSYFYDDGSALRQYDRETGAFVKSLSFSDFGASVPGYEFHVADMMYRDGYVYVATLEGYQTGTVQWHKINPEGLVIEKQSDKFGATFFPSNIFEYQWTWLAATDNYVYLSYMDGYASNESYLKQFNHEGQQLAAKAIAYPNQPASTSVSFYASELWQYGKTDESDMSYKWINTIPSDYYDIRMAADNGQ